MIETQKPYAADVMDTPNPYAAPVNDARHAQGPEPATQVVPASAGLRFTNFVIDYFAQVGIGIIVGIAIVAVQGEQGINTLQNIPELAIGLPIWFAYYFFSEAATSRTLGKLITGTKVVDENGGLPTIGQVFGRTLCRLIPFEVFSFFGSSARGWHDSIPKTYVVKSR